MATKYNIRTAEFDRCDETDCGLVWRGCSNYESGGGDELAIRIAKLQDWANAFDRHIVVNIIGKDAPASECVGHWPATIIIRPQA